MANGSPLTKRSRFANHVFMTLAQYLDKQGHGALTRLAKALGTSKGYLSDIRDNNRTPSVTFAVRLEKATGGEVTAISLLGLDRRKPRKREGAGA